MQQMMQYPEEMLQLKSNLQDLQHQVEELDQEADILKQKFHHEIEQRNIKIENLADEDLERH